MPKIKIDQGTSFSTSLLNHLSITGGSLVKIKAGKTEYIGFIKAVDDRFCNIYLTQLNGNPIMIRLQHIKTIEHLKEETQNENKKGNTNI